MTLEVRIPLQRKNLAEPEKQALSDSDLCRLSTYFERLSAVLAEYRLADLVSFDEPQFELLPSISLR